MRAIRCSNDPTGFVLDARAPEPSPAPGDAVVRTLLAAIDADEIADARRGPRPIIPGRQFIGIVESIRGDAHADLVGRRMLGASSIPCGACDLCRGGVPMHCRERRVPGTGGPDGCLAERFAFPASALVAAPDAIDDDTALLAYPLASAMHAAQQVRLDRRSYVSILGDSALALLCAQVMTKRNASVRVLSEHDDRLDLCEKLGLRRRRLSDAGRRADQDVVVDCVGTAESVRTSLGLVRPRGTIILKQPPGAPVPIDLATVIEREIEIVGSRAGALHEAVALLAGHSDTADAIDTTGLGARRFAFEAAPDAVRAAQRGEHLRVVLHP